jgi:signal peptidase I
MSKKKNDKKKVHETKSFMSHLRDWGDALVIAYILAMFIRTFVVELFKIPTGSMTPTLVGDICTEFDYDENGENDLVLKKGSNLIHVFFKENGKYTHDRFIRNPPMHKLVGRKFKMRSDKILVNKLSYWFHTPKRGDIVVFKVPPVIFDPRKPVYIKRAIGLPGEGLDIGGGHVFINGQKITGEPYDNIEYENTCNGRLFTHRTIGAREILVLGDNTKSSLDSRYWGTVPEENLKGRAILRYSPFNKISFLN